MDKNAEIFYDLEQRILSAWNIIDDLRSIHERWDQCNNKELVKAIVDLYQHKFDVMFTQFEKSMQAYFEIRKNGVNHND